MLVQDYPLFSGSGPERSWAPATARIMTMREQYECCTWGLILHNLPFELPAHFSCAPFLHTHIFLHLFLQATAPNQSLGKGIRKKDILYYRSRLRHSLPENIGTSRIAFENIEPAVSIPTILTAIPSPFFYISGSIPWCMSRQQADRWARVRYFG